MTNTIGKSIIVESVRAIEFALTIDDTMDAMVFLDDWLQGNTTNRWPDFHIWLKKVEEGLKI